jgi:small nuclear ribonucleoprotein (snRNP)-like protein
MTINLEDYIGKTVEVELIGGATLVGKVIKFNTVFHIKFPSYNQDGYSSIPVSPDDIIKIKEIKETPQTEMTINLEDYIGKTVEVELRNGDTITGRKITVDRSISFDYKYVLGTYLNFYSQDGTNETHRDCDMIKIKEIKEPETMSNVIRSKIDVFTTENERVEVTLDDDGLFLTACGKGARQDLSIGSKDLAIAVARAILEHYNETEK